MADEQRQQHSELPRRRSGAARPAARASRRRPADWRGDAPVAPARLRGDASRLWTVGIEARLVYLQVVQHADMMARADRQQLRTISCPAKRGEILDRNGHVLAYSVDADTISADPSDIENPDDVAQLVCGGARRLRRARAAGDGASAARQGTVRLPRAQGVARRSAARQGARAARASRSSRRAAATTRRRSSRRTCSATSASTTPGLAGSSRPTTRRSAGAKARCWSRPTRAGTRCRRRDERPPTAGDGLELTIDQYLQHIAERELRVGVEENRAAGGTAIIMDPHTGEILALANWPTFNPNAFSGVRRSSRAATAPSRISTSRARRSRSSPRRRRSRKHVIAPDGSGRLRPGLHHVRQPRRSTTCTRYGVLPFTDVIVEVEQRRRDQGRDCGSARSGSAATSAGSASARRSRPDFRGENAGIVWNPGAARSERAGVGVDGIPGRRDAAADGGGRQLGRQRRRADRAARRARVHQERPPRRRCRRKVLRRDDLAGDRGDADRHHGSGRRARDRRRSRRSRATPSRARPARRRSWSTAATRSRTTTRRSSGSCRRGSRRSRSSSSSTRRTRNGYYGGDGGGAGLPAHRRSGAAAPRRSARRVNAPPPVLVARHESQPSGMAPRPVRARGASARARGRDASRA